MIPAWARDRADTLLRITEGRSRLERELEWSVMDSIESESYDFPALLSLSHAVALILTDHRQEAQRMLMQAREITHAFFLHGKDPGSSLSASVQNSMFNCLFTCEWLLTGQREPKHLRGSLGALMNVMTRSALEGLELGADDHEEKALLNILVGNCIEALESLPNATESPVDLDPKAVFHGTPTRVKTLAVAAQHLLIPGLSTQETTRRRITDGVAAVMKEQFRKPSPQPETLLLWLDIPNMVTGEQGDPWAMLAQVNEIV